MNPDQFDAELRRFLDARAGQVAGAPDTEAMARAVSMGVATAARHARTMRILWGAVALALVAAVALSAVFLGDRPKIAERSPSPFVPPSVVPAPVVGLDDASPALACAPVTERVTLPIPRVTGLRRPRPEDPYPQLVVWTDGEGRNPELVLQTADGQRLLATWAGGAMTSYASRAPDGIRFAFVGARSAQECSDPWIADLAAGTLTNVPDGKTGFEADPQWSADGSAFLLTRADGLAALYDQEQTRSLEVVQTHGPRRRVLWTGTGWSNYSLAPNGSAVALQDRDRLVIANFDGSPNRIPLLYLFQQGIWWSSDARWVAVIGTISDEPSGMYVVSRSGGEPRLVARRLDESTLISQVVFSADDARVLYDIQRDDGSIVTYAVSRTGASTPVETKHQAAARVVEQVECKPLATVTELSVRTPPAIPPIPGVGLRAVVRHRFEGSPYALPHGATVSILGDGAEHAVLYWPDGFVSEVAWSPDGRRLAMWGRRANECAGPWIVDLVEGRARNVVPPEGESPQADDWASGALTWSPDSSHLVFRAPGEERGLDIVDASGSNARTLYEGARSSSSWSPDGHTIAVMGSDIILIDVDGGATRTIDIDQNGDYYGNTAIAWSSDGRWLAFAGCMPHLAACGLYRASTDGGAPDRVVDFSRSRGGREAAEVAWTDDSQSIRFRMELRTYLVRADGSGLRIDESLQPLGRDFSPATWRPPGS